MTSLWTPKTEQDIVEGIQNGVLRENHYIEVKEQARNEQVAQTLASFAIDGGMFILGIAERKNENGTKFLALAPLPLGGWLERVDGIARNNVEPPLPVRVTTVPSDTEEGAGYVVMTVAASPLAPHMTGGKYFGRGEASKHYLSDAEVVRHHDRRQRQADLGKQLLDEAETNDYLSPDDRQLGHIYLVAEPLMTVSGNTVEDFLHDEAAMRSFVASGENACRVNLASWFPTPRSATQIRHRETGASALTFDADGPGRTVNPEHSSEINLLDIELTYSGGLRIFLARGTASIRGRGGLGGTTPDTDEMAVLDGMAVAYSQRLVFWVGQLSIKYGYQSVWTLGLRMNGVKGLPSYTRVDDFRDFGPFGSLDRDAFTGIATVSTSAILDDPEAVVDSLVGRLLRVLGTTKHHLG